MPFDIKSVSLTIGGTEYNNNIAEGTLKLSRMLCDDKIVFGKACSDMFQCTVFDENGIPDLKGKSIKVTIAKEDGSTETVFRGTIDSAKADSTGLSASLPTGYYRDVVAYDMMYEYGKKDVSAWWETYWTGKETTTLQELRNSFLTENYNGKYDKNMPLKNSHIVLTKDTSFGQILASDMLYYICSLSGVIPHFDSETGSILFYTLSESESAVKNITQEYEKAESSFEDYMVSRIDGIFLSDMNDNVVVKQPETATNAYVLGSNPLIYNADNATLSTIAQNLYLQIVENKTTGTTGISSYIPASIKLISSDFSLYLGDLVETEKGKSYVMQCEYSGSKFVDETIICNGAEKQSEVSDGYSVENVSFGAKTAYFKSSIDGLEAKYTATDGRLTTAETNIKATSEGVSSVVERTTKLEETVDRHSTEITQTDNKISLVVRSGDSESGVVLTDNAMNYIGEHIKLNNNTKIEWDGTQQSFEEVVSFIAPEQYYIYVRYSPNEYGNPMTPEPEADTKYIGIITTTSATVPDSSKFEWKKFVGDNGHNGAPGTPGEPGVGITSAVTEYYLSTSKDTPTGGSWSTEQPEWELNVNYVFERLHIIYSDGTQENTPSNNGVLSSAMMSGKKTENKDIGNGEITQTTLENGTIMYKRLKADSDGNLVLVSQTIGTPYGYVSDQTGLINNHLGQKQSTKPKRPDYTNAPTLADKMKLYLGYIIKLVQYMFYNLFNAEKFSGFSCLGYKELETDTDGNIKKMTFYQSALTPKTMVQQSTAIDVEANRIIKQEKSAITAQKKLSATSGTITTEDANNIVYFSTNAGDTVSNKQAKAYNDDGIVYGYDVTLDNASSLVTNIKNGNQRFIVYSKYGSTNANRTLSLSVEVSDNSYPTIFSGVNITNSIWSSKSIMLMYYDPNTSTVKIVDNKIAATETIVVENAGMYRLTVGWIRGITQYIIYCSSKKAYFYKENTAGETPPTVHFLKTPSEYANGYSVPLNTVCDLSEIDLAFSVGTSTDTTSSVYCTLEQLY